VSSPATKRYWCEYAWLGGDEAEAGVLVSCESERIAAVEAGVGSPPAGAERLGGIVLPGFANAHSHAFHRVLRGRGEAGGGSFWTWREQMYEVAAGLDPDRYLRLARATFAEMALAGFTAVGEFHYLHHGSGGEPYEDRNETGRALIEAARQAGIRITLLDACYLHGGIGEPLSALQRRFSDGDAESWIDRVGELTDGPGVRIGAAIHSVRAVDPDAAAAVAAWARHGQRPLHAHVSEQPAENDAARAAYGRTPTAVLDAAAALDRNFTAVHATHLDAADVAALGASACCCCLCPTTERDLADGIGPARDLVAAGASIALGTDSHALIDPFEEARAVELDERLASGERGRHGAASLLGAATVGGHESIGWPEAGSIATGAPADLVAVSLDGPRLAGARPETLLESVVFAAAAGDVERVVSGGRDIVRDGSHVAIDVASELRESIAGASP
jgi:formiminoglutamate deiminase